MGRTFQFGSGSRRRPQAQCGDCGPACWASTSSLGTPGLRRPQASRVGRTRLNPSRLRAVAAAHSPPGVAGMSPLCGGWVVSTHVHAPSGAWLSRPFSGRSGRRDGALGQQRAKIYPGAGACNSVWDPTHLAQNHPYWGVGLDRQAQSFQGPKGRVHLTLGYPLVKGT